MYKEFKYSLEADNNETLALFNDKPSKRLLLNIINRYCINTDLIIDYNILKRKVEQLLKFKVISLNNLNLKLS